MKQNSMLAVGMVSAFPLTDISQIMEIAYEEWMKWNSVHAGCILSSCRLFQIMAVSVNMEQTVVLQGIMPMIPHMVCTSWPAFQLWPWLNSLISPHHLSCVSFTCAVECWHSVHCFLSFWWMTPMEGQTNTLASLFGNGLGCVVCLR